MGECPSLSLRKRSGLRGHLGAEEAEVGAGCLGGGRVGTALPTTTLNISLMRR